jgi:IS5 family transposase
MIKTSEIKTNSSKTGDFMQPKNLSAHEVQSGLFRSSLDQILHNVHPLFQLARQIDWSFSDTEFGQLFTENVGRPGHPTRLIVGLHYQRLTFNESDESVVECILENPYGQYFNGFVYFQHILFMDPSFLYPWRKRPGPGKLEKLLIETLETAKRGKLITPHHVERVNVDTTVREKAIAFPTYVQLYQKTRRAFVRAVKEREINLRQNYERLGKEAFVRQSRSAYARQFKRASQQTRKLRTFLCQVSPIM